MDRQYLQDGSSGEVVITPGSSSSAGGGGFFGIGGGAGFGGGFGGSSSKRRKKRARARAAALARARAEEQTRIAAAAQAEAQAQAHARAVAHRQLVETYGQAREARKSVLDLQFAVQAQGLAQSLKAEIEAVRARPNSDGSERWQLYLISKQRDELNQLTATKSAEFVAKENVARSFDGQDPLARSAQDYASHLAALGSTQAFDQAHRAWETAYTAAHEARLLADAIRQLGEQASVLTSLYARQQVVWLERELEWERQRQYAEQRAERIRFKQQTDAALRHDRVRQANTLSAPTTAVATAGAILTRSGAWVVQEAAASIAFAVREAVAEILRIAAIRLGQAVSVTVSSIIYSPELGNSDLTPEQRQRGLQGIGLRAELLGLTAAQNLQAIADEGGTAIIDHRLKLEAVGAGTAVHVAATGQAIAAQVPVRNAVFDPLTNTYQVDGQKPSDKSLRFSAGAEQGLLEGAALAPPNNAPGVLQLAPQADSIPLGADLRIDDCIVCIPGQPPLYFSFALPPVGSGVVNGAGQAVSSDWWQAVDRNAGYRFQSSWAIVFAVVNLPRLPDSRAPCGEVLAKKNISLISLTRSTRSDC